jgi:hypothetical protein
MAAVMAQIRQMIQPLVLLIQVVEVGVVTPPKHSPDEQVAPVS